MEILLACLSDVYQDPDPAVCQEYVHKFCCFVLALIVTNGFVKGVALGASC